jgi:hypothetical protein
LRCSRFRKLSRNRSELGDSFWSYHVLVSKYGSSGHLCSILRYVSVTRRRFVSGQLFSLLYTAPEADTSRKRSVERRRRYALINLVSTH